MIKNRVGIGVYYFLLYEGDISMYMTIECKCQVILTDNGYNDFNMWTHLGCKNASRMFDLLKKRHPFWRGD